MDPELERIRENVQMLVSEGAPEADIEAYLKTEGYTLASLNDALGSQPPAISGSHLSPAMGGILDFAKAAILPLAGRFSVSPSFAKQEMDELRARAPEATRTAGLTLPLLAATAAGGGLSHAIGAARGGPLSRWAVQRATGANALGFPAGTAAPAGRSAVLELLKRYALPGAGGGIGAELLRRAIDR